MNRPSETLSAAIASVVAAVISILAAFYPEVAEKITAEVAAAIVLILAWTATVVTWVVSRRLVSVDSPLESAPDGSVVKVEEPAEVIFESAEGEPVGP